MRSLARPLLTVLLFSIPASAQSESPRPLPVETPPEGVEQLLPRGRIAAVFAPEFVEADSADITHDAWVLGVVLDGEARAYSLNLLNRHEVVNDRFGERLIAAVW